MFWTIINSFALVLVVLLCIVSGLLLRLILTEHKTLHISQVEYRIGVAFFVFSISTCFISIIALFRGLFV